MRRWHLLVAGTLATVVTAAWLWPRSSTSERTPAPAAEIAASGRAKAASRELVNLRSAALEHAIHGLQRDLEAMSAELAELRELAESGEDTGADRREREASAPDPEQILIGLDHRLAGEAADPDWGPAVENLLESAAVSIEAQLDSLECRSTMCRMRVRHGDADGREQLLAQLDTLPLRGPRAVKPDDGEGGEIASLVYVIREGHSFVDASP